MSSSNLAELFQLSYWQSWIALIFIVFAFAILIFLKRKKTSTKNIFLAAIGIGLFGGLLFFLMSNYSGSVDNAWEDQALNWLSLTTVIFVSLLIFFVPFLIFTTIIKTFTKKDNSSSIKSIVYSVISLLTLVAIGALLAFLYFWIFGKYIDFSGLPPVEDGGTSGNIISMIEHWVPSSISIFASPEFIVSVVIMAFIFTIVINRIKKSSPKQGESIESFFDHFNQLMVTCIQLVLVLVPFMIATKLPTLFLNNYGVSFVDVIIFVGLIFAGAATIFIIDWFVIFGVSFKQMSFLDVIKKQRDPLLTGFFSQSSSSTLPLTIKASEDLTKNSKYSILIPTLGTSMGLIMCGSFFPVSVTLITANNTPGFDLTLGFFITLFIMAIVVSMGIQGTPGTATISTTTLLQNNGLSLDFFSAIALPLDPIIDPVRTMVNINAIITATVVVSKINGWRDKRTELEETTSMQLYELDPLSNNLKEKEDEQSATVDVTEIEIYNPGINYYNLGNSSQSLEDIDFVDEENVSAFNENEISFPEVDDEDVERNVW